MEEIPIREMRQISIDTEKVVLGIGGFGDILKGKYDGREVAVKRVPLEDQDLNEEEAMLKLDHANIVKLFHCESDENFRYYALELCVASLDHLFLKTDDEKKYNGPMPHHIEVIQQLASGLEHIHSKDLVHGDIRPENVLISVGSAGPDEIRIKWADFGLNRKVDVQGTAIKSEARGKNAWLAPELLKLSGTKNHGTAKGDIFAQGLVFGSLFLNGEHLYGSMENGNEIQDNIIKGNPVNMQKIDGKLRDCYENDLLKKMLEHDPDKRMTSTQVVNQLKAIKNKIVGKEKELLELCGRDSPLDLTEKIKDFIQFGINLNAKDDDGRNALHVLCEKNSSSHLIVAIKLLVQLGIDINAKNNYEENALYILCRYNSTPNLTNAIKLLVELGIDVNEKGDRGMNALHYLCQNHFWGRYDETTNLTNAIKLLVELGIDVNEKDDRGMNALHYLCQSNSTPKLIHAIQLLVQLGVDVNAKGQNGMNALHHLCEYNSTPNLTEAIQGLVKLGIDVNEKCDRGMNALHYLCQNRFLGRYDETTNLTEAIQGLVKLGIDVSEKGDRGMNALHYLCQNHFLGRHDETTNLTNAIQGLVKLGIDVSEKCDRGMNALHYLCQNRFLGRHDETTNLTNAIQLLVKLGIDVKAMDNSYKKAVNYLTEYRSKQERQKYEKKEGQFVDEAIRFLENATITDFSKLKYGENKHGRFKFDEEEEKLYQMHPQEFSSAVPVISGVSIRGDNVNTKDKGKRNELHVLCQSNSSPNLIIEIQRLIELGYKVNDKDKDGMNALHYLCQNRFLGRYDETTNLTNAIQGLVKLGIDVSEKCDRGMNALHYLCQDRFLGRYDGTTNLTDAIQLLVKLGIDVNAMDNSYKKAVNYLTKYRSKQERQKYEKREGQFVDEAIRFLENAAITDFSKLKYGEYKHDRFKFVEEEEKLLQMQPSTRRFSSALPRISRLSIHDDNVNTKDKGKRNELHVLCQSNSSPNLIIEIQRLIKLGYKVNDKDKGGRNVLHYSCQYNSSPNLVEAIKLFIENGIDVNAMDNEEFNALHYLCRFNSSSNLTDAIQMLIQHGIDVNAKNFIGWNALHLSCRFHSSSNLLEILSILIEKGVDINEKTTHGDRAIDILVKNGMDEDQKSNVLRFLIRYGIQVHQENKASPNVNQMNFFKENDNYGGKFLNFLAKKEIRLGWHDGCENCHQILSIERNYRVGLQHHKMFGSCYIVFHFLMKHLEKWAKSIQKSGESELDMKNPTKWLRKKAEQHHQSETDRRYKEDFEVMAEVGDQIKDGSNSGEFNCDNYERYLRSMYSIAEMIDSNESMGQIKWFYLLPFDFPMDYGDEKESDIKRAKIEWDRTLFSWAHKETDEYYGKFMKEDANEGFFLPKEFKHKCHEIDGKTQNHYVEQLFRGMLETNANKRMTSTEIAKQMKSIENKLYEKEEELRQLCATDSSPALVQKIRDMTSLGIDVNAMDKDGRNALHYLCQHNSSSTLIDAIKLLIELGICIMSNGHDARTILRQHYNKSDIEEIIELLDGASRD
ncbi:hypothetical protein OUZ56_031224 [Daphnia magna]|uniref:Protein kinase domain-containing protein n=1 Tax=Daphnia magna TaxID=35525 RepID=A0ABQ9ZTS4_9CRUS|nr:hypothetical protein OUZ56_031224 [Daphnia magna]